MLPMNSIVIMLAKVTKLLPEPSQHFDTHPNCRNIQSTPGQAILRLAGMLATASSMEAYCSLPDHVLQKVLSFVSLAQRFGPCSLASQQFRKAAAEATTAIALDLHDSAARQDGLSNWTQQHGHSITTLQLSKLAQLLKALPSSCSNLQQLDISQCAVQLGEGDQQPGLLAHFTGLTRLVLQDCCAVAAKESSNSSDAVPWDLRALAPISQVSTLQHLELHTARSDNDAYSPRVKVFASLLQQLTQLTHLGLSGHLKLSDSSLEHNSTVTGLQQLRIHSNISTAHLAGLHTLPRLQKLDLSCISVRIGSWMPII